MNRLLFPIFAVALLMTPTIQAQDKQIVASNAWIRLPASGDTSTIGVAWVKNPGMYAIYLLTATSDIAGNIEFRDASKGSKALEEVAVINYETTYMDPKGIHMYFSELKRPLTEGETVYIELKTEAGILVEVEAVVKKE